MALPETTSFARNLCWLSPAPGRQTYFGGSKRSLHLLQRVNLQLSRKICVCRSQSNKNASLSPILKDEAEKVLKIFLKKQRIDNEMASQIINKIYNFIYYLVSELSPDKYPYIVGRKLPTSEIEALLEEHKDLLEEMVKKFLEFSDEEKEFVSPQVSYLLELGMDRNLIRKICRKCARFIHYSLDGKIKPITEFFIEKGFSIDEFGSIVSRYPLYEYDLEGNLVPKWNYFLAMGYQKSDLVNFPFYFKFSLEAKIKPRFERMKECGVRLTSLSSTFAVDSVTFEKYLRNEMDKIIILKYSNPLDLDINARVSENKPHLPQVSYLLDLGMDLSSIQGIRRKFPAFALYIMEDKIKPVVDFLLDLGVSKPEICKIIYKRPELISASLTENIIPCLEYYRSLGIDVVSLIVRRPRCFELSIETHIKPISEFFIENGFNIGELTEMVSKVSLFTMSLEENLVPKWEFFLTMGYTRSELVMFPQYFYFNLEKRIKPRFRQMSERGLRFKLNALFFHSKSKFQARLVKGEIEKSRSLSLDRLEAYLLGNCRQTTEFFYNEGFSSEEIYGMVSKYAILFSLSPVDILMPKWRYFLEMGYPKSELLKFPNYFGYNLERRIKYRYERMVESGIRLPFRYLVGTTESQFEELFVTSKDNNLKHEISRV